MSSSDITHTQDTAVPCPYKSGDGYIGLGDGWSLQPVLRRFGVGTGHCRVLNFCVVEGSEFSISS